MKHFVLIAALLAPVSISAQEAEAESDAKEGLTLMERGAKLFFEGLFSEVEPAIEGMKELAEEMGPSLTQMLEEMGPAFREMLAQVDDLSNYEPPVMLPNGDILLQRKLDAPELLPLPEPGENGDVEL